MDSFGKERSVNPTPPLTMAESPSAGTSTMDTSGSRLGREIHPMNNSTILQNLFNVCSVETLKKFRLVSKSWNNLSKQAWGKKAVLGNWNSKVIKLLRDGEMSPRTGYNLTKPSSVRDPLFQKELWNEGTTSSVKYLKMSVHTLQQSKWPLLAETLSKFSNLEHLCIVFYGALSAENKLTFIVQPMLKVKRLVLDFKREDRIQISCSEWMKVFQKIPNLKVLQLKHDFVNFDLVESMPSFHQTDLTIMTALKDLRSSGESTSCCNLTESDFYPSKLSTPSQRGIIKLINECHFPLKKLRVYLGVNDPVELDAFQELFDSNLTTLEHLTVDFVGFSEGDVIDTVGINSPIDNIFWSQPAYMEKLNLVQLNGQLSSWLFILRNVKAPRLQEIKLREKAHRVCNYLTDIRFQDSFGGLLFPSVKVLNIDACQCLLSPRKIEILKYVMPNLTCLTVSLDPPTFRAVCKAWPKLRSLTVLKGDRVLDDEALTGVIEGFTPKGDLTRPPNITDLTELRDLTIFPSRDLQYIGKEHLILTDHSVIHGFLCLPRLQSLHVGFKLISKCQEDALKTRILDFGMFTYPKQLDVKTVLTCDHRDREPTEIDSRFLDVFQEENEDRCDAI